MQDLSLLLPGVAGRKNLAPFYNKLHRAIRQLDEETLIFWEPVTWGYAIPWSHHEVYGRILELILSKHNMLDTECT